MDFTNYDNNVAQQLGDPLGCIYPQATRLSAEVSAVLEYSRYRPCLRRLGNGEVFIDAQIGQNYIDVVGGPFLPNDVITIDPLLSSTETATITSMVPEAASSTQTCRITRLNLQANLTKLHTSGSMLTKLSSTVVGGISLIAGQDTYALPLDWIRIEIESFDLTIGAKSQVRRGNGFYDAAYVISNELSGVGGGLGSNFMALGGSLGGLLTPFALTPSGQPISNTSFEIVYRFLSNNTPQLIVTPVPVVPSVLDFYYYGGHTFNSLPDKDMDPCIDYARYKVLSAQASVMAAQIDYAIQGSVRQTPSASARSLREEALVAYNAWRKKIVLMPYVTNG